LIDDPGVDDSLIPAVCGQQGDLGTMVALQQQLGDFEIKFKRSVVDTTQAFVKQLKFDLSQLKSKPNVHAQALVTVGHPASTATISLSSMASSTPMARFTLTPRRPPGLLLRPAVSIAGRLRGLVDDRGHAVGQDST
jgi:hypothetical protein